MLSTCVAIAGLLTPLSSRRSVVLGVATAALRPSSPAGAFAVKESKPPIQASAALDALPKNTAAAFQRYWPAMQLGADFYAFELLERVKAPQKWDLVGSFVGGGQAGSRLELEFLSPMTILALAFPPDEGGDRMQAALQDFRASMGKLSSIAGSSPGPTAGPTPAEKAMAMGQWDSGRLALNRFLVALNDATETTRLTTIPEGAIGYPRSAARYLELRQGQALCRNRGGEALAGVWSGLMVYGTVPGVNPCGDVNLGNYFDQ